MGTIRPTRFKGLGYRQDGPGFWRIYDIDASASVGPHYTSKAELLADLDRYATDYGCEGTYRSNLQADNERLRGALQMLADWWDEGDAPIHPGALIDGDSDRTVKDLIRAALAGTENGQRED